MDVETEKKCYSAYVSPIITLKKFLEIPNIFKEILKYKILLESESNILSNIIQADFWKEKMNNVVNKIVLPFKIFFDDFETRNGLGSHGGDNKFGGIYGLIDCLPPDIASKLECIQVISLFYSDDRKTFGNESVFQRLMRDLNFLKNNGIELNIKNRLYKVFFEVSVAIGDNMGVNSLFSMAESFTAKCYCRFCKAPNDVTKFMTKEDWLLNRTVKNYEEDLMENLLTSIMYRYQLKLCSLYYNGLNYNDMITSKSLKKNNAYIKACFPNIENTNEINMYNFVVKNSCRYEVGGVYLIELDKDNDNIDFGKIHCIFIYKDEVNFCMYLLESLSYDKQRQAYVVKENEQPNILVKLKDIPFYTYCTIDKTDNLYVNTRFKF